MLVSLTAQAHLFRVLDAYGRILEAVAEAQRARPSVRAHHPAVLTNGDPQAAGVGAGRDANAVGAAGPG